MLALLFFHLVLILNCGKVRGFCGENIRWSHNFNFDDIYGLWYGVGYAQHTPDFTNKPKEIGCVAVYITDATYDYQDEWIDWSVIYYIATELHIVTHDAYICCDNSASDDCLIFDSVPSTTVYHYTSCHQSCYRCDTMRRNYSNMNWRSYKSNPWSGDALSGSWLDIPLNIRTKRQVASNRRLRVIWDEDGQTMEQTYFYNPEDPGIWIQEQWRPGQREMLSRGVEIWYPNDPPQHPELIRVLKVTPEVLILNHCSDVGASGMFSLIFRRSYTPIDRWEWYDLKNQFYDFDIPGMYRLIAVCASCTLVPGSMVVMFSCFTILLNV